MCLCVSLLAVIPQTLVRTGTLTAAELRLQMDQSYFAKISGFGLAKVKEYSTKLTGAQRQISTSRVWGRVWGGQGCVAVMGWIELTARPRGPVADWQAPEVLEMKPYSKAADVYSFGMVCWELVSRQVPFQHLENPVQMAQCIIAGERPTVRVDQPTIWVTA